MFRPSAKFLLPLLALLVGLQAVQLVVASDPALALRPNLADLVHAGLPVLVLVLVGRIALAWLPAGRPGGHGPRELAVTLAVSLALGEVLLALITRLTSSSASDLSAWWLAPVAVLAALRLATLPGSLVPGHPVPHEPSSSAARASFALAFVAIAWLTMAATWTEPFPGVFGLATNQRVLVPHQLATALLLAHGLEEARRAPLGRALALLLLAVSIPYGMGASLSAALGCAYLIGWLRRADRRACVLSACGFLGVALAGTPTVGACGLIALVLLGRPEQAREAARVVLLPLALTVAIAFGPFEAPWARGEPRAWAQLLGEFPFWRIPLGALAFTALWLPIAVWLGPKRPVSIAEPVRESVAVLLVALVGVVALLRGEPGAIPTVLAPLVFLLGLVWSPPERGLARGLARADAGPVREATPTP